MRFGRSSCVCRVGQARASERRPTFFRTMNGGPSAASRPCPTLREPLVPHSIPRQRLGRDATELIGGHLCQGLDKKILAPQYRFIDAQVLLRVIDAVLE